MKKVLLSLEIGNYGNRVIRDSEQVQSFLGLLISFLGYWSNGGNTEMKKALHCLEIGNHGNRVIRASGVMTTNCDSWY